MVTAPPAGHPRRSRSWRVGSGVLLALLALAPGGRGLLTGAAEGYEDTASVADAGSLAGIVRFVGTAPRFEPLPVQKNRDVCGETKESEVLVVGASRGVSGGVVLIEGVRRGKKPDQDVLLNNVRCQFAPHVSAVMAGSRVRVKNSDPVLHNTHGTHGRPTVFNLALPNKDQVIDITRRLSKPGAIRVLCDAHTHMSAWLYVHDSPYIAVTDGSGRYRIDGIPPGRYAVVLWHEGFTPRGKDKDGRPVYDEPRSTTREVTIPPSGTTTLDFELK